VRVHRTGLPGRGQLGGIALRALVGLAGREAVRAVVVADVEDAADFSPVALASVIALAVTGTAQAIVEVGGFPALVETGYGRAVVAKARGS
jgi:putative copper export protein